MNNYEDWAQLVAKKLKGEADLIAAIEKDELDDAAASDAFGRAVLTPFLPENYGIGSGRVADAFGNHSEFLDIIIYNRDFPRIGLHNTNDVYLYESVLAAFSVRAKFIRKTLFDSLNACASLAQLESNIDKTVLIKLAKKNGLRPGPNKSFIHDDPLRTARFELIGRPPAFVFGFSGIKNSYRQLQENLELWIENRTKVAIETPMKALPAVIATQGCFAWRNAAPLALSIGEMLGIGNDHAPVRLVVLQLLYLLNRRLNVTTDGYGLKPNLNAYLGQFSAPKFELGVGNAAAVVNLKATATNTKTAASQVTRKAERKITAAVPASDRATPAESATPTEKAKVAAKSPAATTRDARKAKSAASAAKPTAAPKPKQQAAGKSRAAAPGATSAPSKAPTRSAPEPAPPAAAARPKAQQPIDRSKAAARPKTPAQAAPEPAPVANTPAPPKAAPTPTAAEAAPTATSATPPKVPTPAAAEPAPIAASTAPPKAPVPAAAETAPIAASVTPPKAPAPAAAETAPIAASATPPKAPAPAALELAPIGASATPSEAPEVEFDKPSPFASAPIPPTELSSIDESKASDAAVFEKSTPFASAPLPPLDDVEAAQAAPRQSSSPLAPLGSAPIPMEHETAEIPLPDASMFDTASSELPPMTAEITSATDVIPPKPPVDFELGGPIDETVGSEMEFPDTVAISPEAAAKEFAKTASMGQDDETVTEFSSTEVIPPDERDAKFASTDVIPPEEKTAKFAKTVILPPEDKPQPEEAARNSTDAFIARVKKQLSSSKPLFSGNDPDFTSTIPQ